MKFLDGVKTVIGLLGLVVATVAPQVAPVVNELGPQVVGIIQGVFGALATLGVVHKVEKHQDAKTPQPYKVNK